jgi:OOP family OmpA-OmpF porin
MAEYRTIALFEADEMYDWIDAGHFARKGLRAAAGEEVEAERLEEWRLPREHQAELAAARDRLMAAFEADARVKAPLIAARAQGSFDCWVEQQEENHQLDHIAACRDAFYSNLNIVTDILDLQTELQPELIPVPSPTLDIEERVPFTVVLFAFDEAALDTQARAAAVRVADEAARRPAAALTVIGHTDRRGPEAYNLDLSLRRAEALRDALVARGVAAARIEVVGRGEWQAAVPTADGVAEAANRRVEIFFKREKAVEPGISSVSSPSVLIADQGPERAIGHGETVTAGDTTKTARRLHLTAVRGGVSIKSPLPRPPEDKMTTGPRPQWTDAAHDVQACMTLVRGNGCPAAARGRPERAGSWSVGTQDPGRHPIAAL